MPALCRRHLILTTALLPLTPLPARAQPADAALADLERRAGGRLGVALLDTASGALQGHRLDERFGLCSTFKLLLAAAVLQRPDPEGWIAFGAGDLVRHSPVTSARLAEGRMRAVELAEATQKTSDNTAANLLLRERFGGPAGFTAWLREQGDSTTRIDRTEPAMNLVPPGDERDTSAPAAIARSSARLLVGGGLTPAAAARLIGWMEATQTGSQRLRAGLPAGWRAGDKTGTAMHPSMPDKINDIALIWPPGRAPWLVAAFYEGPQRGSPGTRPQDEAVLAEVGRIAAAAMG